MMMKKRDGFGGGDEPFYILIDYCRSSDVCVVLTTEATSPVLVRISPRRPEYPAYRLDIMSKYHLACFFSRLLMPWY